MSGLPSEKRVGVQRYALALSRELSFLPPPSNVREVAIVWCRSQAGTYHVGEVSPLPGFSRDSLCDSLREFAEIQHRIPPIEDLRLASDEGWGGFLNEIRSPALRCGLEGVALDYLFHDAAWCAAHVVTVDIACNALVVSQSDISLERQIRYAIERGFSSIKIKVSPETIMDVVACLERLSKLNDINVTWRLDPNRSFSFEEFVRVMPRLAGIPIEYIEEPVCDIQHLPRLIAQSSIPIALDETTRELPVAEWLMWGARYVVIKPTLSGGLLSLRPLIKRIAESSGHVTLSSSFESGIGLRAIALLASLLPNCGAVGLDTAAFFEDDILLPRFPSGVPRLSLSALVGARFKGEVGL
jgi:O-succinylbenzoate synthase